MLTWMKILWPSFLTAGVAEGVFFSLFDPVDMLLLGTPVGASRTAVYSVGFLAFWAFAAASSGLTSFLQRGDDDATRCEVPAEARPPGCARRRVPAGATQA